MNSDKSTNCKHCHYYHGKNGIVCANHPFGSPKENYCPDYRASDVKYVLNWSYLISCLISIIILGEGLLNLIYLSFAGFKYSFDRWFAPLSSFKAENFISHLKFVSHEISWLTISIGLFVVFLCSVIGGTGFIVIILLDIRSYAFEKKGDLE